MYLSGENVEMENMYLMNCGSHFMQSDGKVAAKRGREKTHSGNEEPTDRKEEGAVLGFRIWFRAFIHDFPTKSKLKKNPPQ